MLWAMNDGESKKTKPRVTIIVGIICKGGIVLAADSRTTLDAGSSRDDTEKVHLIQMRNSRAIIARSGHDHLSGQVIYRLQAKAEGFEPEDWRACSELAESAVNDARSVIRKLAKTPKQLEKRFTDYPMTFLLGYYYKEQPYLYKLDFLLGLSSPKKREHLCIGCAAPLADFILRDIDTSEMTPEQAMALAIYTVEEVKLNDPRCGGPTRIGISSWYNGKLATTCFATPMPRRTINALMEYSNSARQKWIEGLQAVIDRLTRKRTENQPTSDPTN
jgi:20S proteasome alpha/beta subunit